MIMSASRIGAQLEDIAAAYLQTYNLTIVCRNFCCKSGEIDLIANDQNCLVFVEVRYRSYASFGSAAESVTYTKQKKIIRAAHCYLQANNWAQDLSCRFDVIAIAGTPTNPNIDWIKDAFYAYI